jgi:hypothetical protein
VKRLLFLFFLTTALPISPCDHLFLAEEEQRYFIHPVITRKVIYGPESYTYAIKDDIYQRLHDALPDMLLEASRGRTYLYLFYHKKKVSRKQPLDPSWQLEVYPTTLRFHCNAKFTSTEISQQEALSPHFGAMLDTILTRNLERKTHVALTHDNIHDQLFFPQCG